jgi:hypothetical protein
LSGSCCEHPTPEQIAFINTKIGTWKRANPSIERSSIPEGYPMEQVGFEQMQKTWKAEQKQIKQERNEYNRDQQNADRAISKW